MHANLHNVSSIVRSLGYVAAGTAAMLLVPLAAMQLSTAVVWTVSDFFLMGALLMGAGSSFVFTARLVRTRQQRRLLGAVVALLTLLVWLELAVGLVGSPLAGS